MLATVLPTNSRHSPRERSILRKTRIFLFFPWTMLSCTVNSKRQKIGVPEPELKSEVFEYLSGRKVRHYFLNFSILALIAWLLDPAIAGKLFFFWFLARQFENAKQAFSKWKAPRAGKGTRRQIWSLPTFRVCLSFHLNIGNSGSNTF